MLSVVLFSLSFTLMWTEHNRNWYAFFFLSWLDINNSTSFNRFFLSVCVIRLKLFWFTNSPLPPKKFSYAAVVLCLCLIYIVKAVCWYIWLRLFFHHKWLEYCLHIYKVPEKSYAWLVYWFISLCPYFMTWHDFTTLCGIAYLTKLQRANTQGRIFSLLVVCCVKMGMTIMSS